MPVYILTDQQRIKIGYSANPDRRIKTHLSSHPGLAVLAIVPEGDRRMEQALHRLLNGHRCAGTTEWFWDNPTTREVLGNVLGRLDNAHSRLLA